MSALQYSTFICGELCVTTRQASHHCRQPQKWAEQYAYRGGHGVVHIASQTRLSSFIRRDRR